MWILVVDFSSEFLVTTSLMDLEEGQKRGGGIKERFGVEIERLGFGVFARIAARF